MGLVEIMQKLFTYVLLLIVVAAQLFGSSAVTTLPCAQASCQCSIQAKAEGHCCCSADTSACCNSKKKTTCCGGRGDDSATLPAVCTCGCQHSSEPVPAQTETSPRKLYRLICASTVCAHDSVARDGAFPTSATRSTDLYDGPSTQPLYCCWLI